MYILLSTIVWPSLSNREQSFRSLTWRRSMGLDRSSDFRLKWSLTPSSQSTTQCWTWTESSIRKVKTIWASSLHHAIKNYSAKWTASFRAPTRPSKTSIPRQTSISLIWTSRTRSSKRLPKLSFSRESHSTGSLIKALSIWFRIWRTNLLSRTRDKLLRTLLSAISSMKSSKWSSRRSKWSLLTKPFKICLMVARHMSKSKEMRQCVSKKVAKLTILQNTQSSVKYISNLKKTTMDHLNASVLMILTERFTPSISKARAQWTLAVPTETRSPTSFESSNHQCCRCSLRLLTTEITMETTASASLSTLCPKLLPTKKCSNKWVGISAPHSGPNLACLSTWRLFSGSNLMTNRSLKKTWSRLTPTAVRSSRISANMQRLCPTQSSKQVSIKISRQSLTTAKKSSCAKMELKRK